ncbi:protein of unknown function [Streptomyces murinus]
MARAAGPMRRARMPICLVLPTLSGPLNAIVTGRTGMVVFSEASDTMLSGVREGEELEDGPSAGTPKCRHGEAVGRTPGARSHSACGWV